MKNLFTKLRDWWNKPIIENIGLHFAMWLGGQKRIENNFLELNNQIDFLKYQVSGLMSDEEWRRVLTKYKPSKKSNDSRHRA